MKAASRPFIAEAYELESSGAHRLERVFGTAEALQVVPQVVLGLFLRPQGKAAPFLVTNMHLKSRVQEKLLPAGMDYTAPWWLVPSFFFNR